MAMECGKYSKFLSIKPYQLTEKHVAVPVVAIFTKFDGLIIQEHANLHEIKDQTDKLIKAKENAEYTLQQVYISKVMSTAYPPKAYVHLGGESGKYL